MSWLQGVYSAQVWCWCEYRRTCFFVINPLFRLRMHVSHMMNVTQAIVVIAITSSTAILPGIIIPRKDMYVLGELWSMTLFLGGLPFGVWNCQWVKLIDRSVITNLIELQRGHHCEKDDECVTGKCVQGEQKCCYMGSSGLYDNC